MIAQVLMMRWAMVAVARGESSGLGCWYDALYYRQRVLSNEQNAC
jgi:hypothetical protein